MKRILLSPDADGGGSPSPEASETITPGSPPPSAAPPAAAIVVTGVKSERETQLETDLADERTRHAATAGEKKARENRINELEDELRKLKTTPAKKEDHRSTLEKWFDGEDV